jgi:hypothetical protein
VDLFYFLFLFFNIVRLLWPYGMLSSTALG